MAKPKYTKFNERQKEYLNAPLSKMLKMSLEDLEAAEKDKNYIIDMCEWVRPGATKKDPCAVCFGGATLVMTFGVKGDYEGSIRDLYDMGFDPMSAAKLYKIVDAVDDIRVGNIRGALETFGIEPYGLGIQQEFDIISYDTDPKKFKDQIREIIDHLKENGL